MAAAFGLAGCGGSSGAHSGSLAPAPASTQAAARGTVTANLTLTIPAKGILAHGRTPQYISPSTADAIVTVNGTPQSFALMTSSPNCEPVTGGTACNLPVQAPIGNNISFAVELTDGTNALSAGAFTANIAEGASNVTFPLVLGGVPAEVDVTAAGIGPFFTLDGGAQTVPLTVTVRDAGGNIIIGNDPYTNASGAVTPITVTSSLGGSTITYATAPYGGSYGSQAAAFTLSAPSDTLEMIYSGSGVPAGYDAFTYAPASIQSHLYGASPKLGIGLAWRAPFVPVSISPISSDVASAGGVPQTAVVTDGTSQLAVAGGTQCTVPGDGNPTTGVYSIAVDPGASSADPNVYVINATTVSALPATTLTDVPLTSFSGTCGTAAQTLYSSLLHTGGIVRATGGTITYYLGNATVAGGAQSLLTATSTSPTTFAGGATYNGTLGGLAVDSVGAQTCYSQSPVTIYAYLYPLSATPNNDGGANSSESGTCAGIAIDPSTNQLFITAVGATSATRFTPFPLSSENTLSLSGSVIDAAQSSDRQMVDVGQWHASRTAFFDTSAGIEVHSQTYPYAGLTNLSLTASSLAASITSGTVEAIAYGPDNRLWTALSSGYVVALPMY